MLKSTGLFRRTAPLIGVVSLGITAFAMGEGVSCWCNELSSACNSMPTGPILTEPDSCIEFLQDSTTIVQAMPSGAQSGWKGWKAVPNTLGTCSYKVGSLVNGVCVTTNKPRRSASVASTEIDTAQGQCAQPCNATPID